MDEERIRAAIESALLTDEEFERFLRGESLGPSELNNPFARVDFCDYHNKQEHDNIDSDFSKSRLAMQKRDIDRQEPREILQKIFILTNISI